MNIKIVLSLIFVFGLGKQIFSQSSELKILEKEILTGQDGVDYWLYQYSNTVLSSDTIKLWDRKISSPFKESVLFFIDDDPFSNWTHPCRYVFVDKNSKGAYKVISETSPPTNFEGYSLLSQINIPTGYKYNFSTLKKMTIP